jgi:DNA-binding transcriptional ArsR family regulator
MSWLRLASPRRIPQSIEYFLEQSFRYKNYTVELQIIVSSLEKQTIKCDAYIILYNLATSESSLIRIHLEPKDIALIRFGISPLAELVTGLREALYSSRPSIHAPWVKESRAALEQLDLGLFKTLVRSAGYMPDFLTPPPTDGTPSFDTELQRLLSTSPEQIKLEVSQVMEDSQPSERLTAFTKQPQESVARLADFLEESWSLVLEPHWPRLRALHENDITPRANKLALGQTASVLADLHPVTHFCGGVLELRQPLVSTSSPTDLRLSGRGLLLVPEIFSWPRVSILSGDYWQPSLYYSPRGVATVWGEPALPACKALELALGKQRAKVLLAVPKPKTTEDISRELNVTTGNVSHHLGRLKRAGLIDVRREGRLLFYNLSAKGEALLKLFS